MYKTGKVVRWVDDKGFGFIAPAKGGPEAFVHIDSLPRGPRPAVGATVRYREVRDAQGRIRAQGVELAEGPDLALGTGPAERALLVMLAFPAGLAMLVASGRLPATIAWLYATNSLITFWLYFKDKRAARRGAQRTPEKTLHLWAFLGGWPGALCAQQLLRHKSVKKEFRRVFWISVALNLAVLGYLVSDPGVPLAARIDQAGRHLAALVAGLPWQEWLAFLRGAH